MKDTYKALPTPDPEVLPPEDEHTPPPPHNSLPDTQLGLQTINPVGPDTSTEEMDRQDLAILSNHIQMNDAALRSPTINIASMVVLAESAVKLISVRRAIKGEPIPTSSAVSPSSKGAKVKPYTIL